MMFSIIKGKLQSVQDNLTTSFRGLKIADNTVPHNSREKLAVDLNAGAELLHKYQTEWQEMHMMAEDNALAAQKVDASIGLLSTEAQRQSEIVTRLTSALSSLPTLAANTEHIISQIERLHEMVISVEETLVELADTVEKKKQQDQQLESRYQLAIYGEHRLAQLDTLRAKLSEEHRQKVSQYEKQFEKKQKERQETFGKVFEEDLQTYKKTGKIPTIRAPLASGPSLEEVELDADTEALNRMLEE